MACGTPVVTSNVSSLPEVVGDAAVLVDPHDAAGDRRRHRAGPDRRRPARGAPRARVSRARGEFSWERSVAAQISASLRDDGRGSRGDDARRARPRLADRHARRREGARSAVPSAIPDADLFTLVHVPGIRLARHRAASDPHVVLQRPAGIGAALPALPAAVPGGGRAVRPRWLRPGHQHQPLRGQGGRSRPGGARISATASRRCGTRGTSSTRTSARSGWAGRAAALAAAGPARSWRAGTRDGRPRQPLCGYFPLCCQADPPIL